MNFRLSSSSTPYEDIMKRIAPSSDPSGQSFKTQRTNQIAELDMRIDDIWKTIFSHTSLDELITLRFTCKQFLHISNEVIREKICNELTFGKQQWEKYYGDIGDPPPLPPNIEVLLNSSCPFWSDKKVKDTHLLVLIPETVNGKPFTLNFLKELIRNPKVGLKTKFKNFDDNLITELGNQSTLSHWVLMTRDVIPNSRDKTYAEKKKYLATYAQSGQPYELPTVIEAVTCILMEYVQTSKQFYNWLYPATYTVCQERDCQSYVITGGFSAKGIDILPLCDEEMEEIEESIGAGGVLTFSSKKDTIR